jgi:hypothetical protein
LFGIFFSSFPRGDILHLDAVHFALICGFSVCLSFDIDHGSMCTAAVDMTAMDSGYLEHARRIIGMRSSKGALDN